MAPIFSFLLTRLGCLPQKQFNLFFGCRCVVAMRHFDWPITQGLLIFLSFLKTETFGSSPKIRGVSM